MVGLAQLLDLVARILVDIEIAFSVVIVVIHVVAVNVIVVVVVIVEQAAFHVRVVHAALLNVFVALQGDAPQLGEQFQLPSVLLLKGKLLALLNRLRHFFV